MMMFQDKRETSHHVVMDISPLSQIYGNSLLSSKLLNDDETKVRSNM